MDGFGAETPFGERVLARAAVNTRRAFRSTSRNLRWAAFAVAAGFTVYCLLRGLPAAWRETPVLAVFALMPLALLVLLVWLWNLFLSPSELAFEAANAGVARANVPDAPPKPAREVNWIIWKQMDAWSLRQFAAILAREEPASGRLSPERAAYLKLLRDDATAGRLTYVREQREDAVSGRTREVPLTADTMIKKSIAIRWADAHPGFDVSHVR